MEYLIDSADLKQIEKLNDIYPIAGVTTNPLILSRCKIDVKSAITGIRAIIGQEKKLHVQVHCNDYKGMIEQAKKLADLAGDNTYIKIPVTEDGLKAIRLLSDKGYKITATAIFTPQQAIVAAAAGALYVAPYINRLDNIATNGIEIAGNINKLLNDEGSKCKVLAASFSNVEQIHMTIMYGVTCLTIPPELFANMIYHPLTQSAVDEFMREGEKYYNI